MPISSDVQKLAPGSVVDLFEIDATAYNLGILRYSPNVNELGDDIIWQGETYYRFPVTASGFEARSTGTLPRPSMVLANVGGLIGQLFRLYNNLLGCKVTRRRTLVKYLDAVNFTGGNPYADPNAHLPDNIYYVDRLAELTPEFVRVELALSWDVRGIQLPFRQVIRDTCIWEYRGADCGYTGSPVATVADVPTGNMSEDKCSKHMSGCRLRFPAPAELPASFFPSVGLIRQ